MRKKRKKMSNEQIKLTPENFCYLSKCKFFLSNIESTGCKIDYMRDNQKKHMEGLCPLVMERSIKSDDLNWKLCNQRVVQKLRDLTDSFQESKRILDKMGSDAYMEALKRCSKLAQRAYDAKIEYEKLQYELQETKDMCFGEFEREKK